MNYTNSEFFATAIALGLNGAAHLLTNDEFDSVAASSSQQQTVFLKFQDEQSAKNVLSSVGLFEYSDAGDSWITSSHVHALDVIGVIQIPRKVADPDNGEETKVDTLDGFHVNYIGNVPLPSSVLQYAIQPEIPHRDFAK